MRLEGGGAWTGGAALAWVSAGGAPAAFTDDRGEGVEDGAGSGLVGCGAAAGGV